MCPVDDVERAQQVAAVLEKIGTVEEAIANLRKALAAQLGVAGIVALTRLQASPYIVTYRGQPISEVLAFTGKGEWK